MTCTLHLLWKLAIVMWSMTSLIKKVGWGGVSTRVNKYYKYQLESLSFCNPPSNGVKSPTLTAGVCSFGILCLVIAYNNRIMTDEEEWRLCPQGTVTRSFSRSKQIKQENTGNSDLISSTLGFINSLTHVKTWQVFKGEGTLKFVGRTWTEKSDYQAFTRVACLQSCSEVGDRKCLHQRHKVL